MGMPLCEGLPVPARKSPAVHNTSIGPPCAGTVKLTQLKPSAGTIFALAPLFESVIVTGVRVMAILECGHVLTAVLRELSFVHSSSRVQNRVCHGRGRCAAGEVVRSGSRGDHQHHQKRQHSQRTVDGFTPDVA